MTMDTRPEPPPFGMDRKPPPHDIDVEQALLGTMLRDNEKIDVAAAELEAAHFYDPLHARIFDMLIQLRAEGSQVNARTLHAIMRHDPGVLDTGGEAYFDALRSAAPASPLVPEYAEILKELHQRREIILIGEDLAAAGHLPATEGKAKDFSADATDRLLVIGAATKKPILSATEIAMERAKELEAIRRGDPVPAVMTGLDKVDKETGGFRGSDLIIIGGKSGMGKSALMGSISRNTAAGDQDKGGREPVPTIVFSLEMTREQWVDRMSTDQDYNHALAEGIDPLWYSKLRNGRVTDKELERFYLAARQLPPRELLEIHDDDDLTVAQIAARSRAFAAKFARKPDGTHRLGIIIVDYLQIISPPDWREANRERQVAAIARGLKSMAKRIGWPVVVGSQLNEDDKGRSKDEKRPQLGDARESKAIGQEADMFFSPYRTAFYVENRKPLDAVQGDPAYLAWAAELKTVRHKMELLTLKNRHGRRQDYDLWCDMAASAVRDERPWRKQTASEPDLLEPLNDLDNRAPPVGG